MVSLAQREKRAQEMFYKYFEESSEYYLYVDNFDIEVGRFETELERIWSSFQFGFQDLRKKALENPQKDTFSEVQEQLWAILSMQCWAGYKKSKFFQEIADCRYSIQTTPF